MSPTYGAVGCKGCERTARAEGGKTYWFVPEEDRYDCGHVQTYAQDKIDAERQPTAGDHGIADEASEDRPGQGYNVKTRLSHASVLVGNNFCNRSETGECVSA